MDYSTYLKKLRVLEELNLTKEEQVKLLPEISKVKILKELNLSEDQIKVAFNKKDEIHKIFKNPNKYRPVKPTIEIEYEF